MGSNSFGHWATACRTNVCPWPNPVLWPSSSLGAEVNELPRVGYTVGALRLRRTQEVARVARALFKARRVAR
jgi:hypothetical protein